MTRLSYETLRAWYVVIMLALILASILLDWRVG